MSEPLADRILANVREEIREEVAYAIQLASAAESATSDRVRAALMVAVINGMPPSEANALLAELVEPQPARP